MAVGVSVTPARETARDVLTRVRERASYAHEVLDATLRRSDLSDVDASFATKLAYGVLQTEGTLDDALAHHLGGKRVEPRVRDCLRLSTYELLFLGTAPRVAVHQGVELVRSVRPQAAGLANAVLRRLGDEAPTFPWGDPHRDAGALARATGHPQWLVDMWVRELGFDAAAGVAYADNEPAPLFLATNEFVASPDRARSALRADGALPGPCPLRGCVIAADAGAAVRGAALREGLVVAVDGAAQLVARFCKPQAGSRVVEIGAGRGTKTLLLQALAREAGGVADITAVELHGFKARLLSERLEAYDVPGVRVVVGDATDLSTVEGAPGMRSSDVVLVDAPCTGLGALRRHPDKRWRLDPHDIETLATLGERLLTSAASLVRPGGFVVYSTCTIAERENREVIRRFLRSRAGHGFSIDDLAEDVPSEWEHFVTPEGFFQSLPEPDGPDGHFGARLRRE
jgi:16S rRNA (cytosine967-C5)-methyltransferase